VTPTQFREALRALHYTHQRFAARVGTNVRTVRRWASGATPVPAAVALVLALEEERQVADAKVKILHAWIASTKR